MKKDWRERELTMEVVVGAFMVMIFLGLGYFTIILSQNTWFTEKTEMRVVFGNVMGLRDGDSVIVRGMPIGKVRSLDLANECGGVCINLMLDKPVELREDYEMTIVTTSMLGGRQLQIFEGSTNLPVVVRDVYVGRDPHDLMADAAEIVDAVREALVEGGAIENLRETVANINTMVARVEAGDGILGKLFSTDTKLYDDLEASVASLRAVLGRVEKGEGSIGKLLAADDHLYQDLADAATALKKIAERVEKGEGTVGALLSSDDTVYRDLKDAVASLKNVAAKIDGGEGMLGKLVSDGEIYEDFRAIVAEVRAAVDDFRETSPVTTFTSVFFGAF